MGDIQDKNKFYLNLYKYNKGINNSYSLKQETYQVFKNVNIEQANIIVDLGSGPGVVAKILADRFKKEIICLDYAFDALKNARKLSTSIDTIQGDGYKLPFKENTIDIIFIREFSILNNPDFFQTIEYLESLQSLLKEGGYLIVIHSSNLTNKEKRGWIHYDYLNHFSWWANLTGYDTRLFYKISAVSIFPLSHFFTLMQLRLISLLRGKCSGKFILVSEKKSRKKKVVVCSYDFFYGTRKYGLHYLTEYFIKDHNVLFITVRNVYLDILRNMFLKKIRIVENTKYAQNFKTFVLYVLCSPMRTVPFIKSYIYAKIFLNFSIPNIKTILKKNRFFNCDIVMFETNSEMGIMSIINSKFSIYRLCDPYGGYDFVSKGQLEYEKEVINKASVVLAVNSQLYDYAVKLKKTEKGIYLLPNGIDEDIFFGSYPRPVEYKDIKTPIIIYVGTFQIWFDWNLLFGIADLLTECTIVLIGSGSVPRKLPNNVIFIGPMPHDKIPPYLQYAHVGIIPFKDLPRMEYVETPLKYFEYLASGIPIVSVPFGNLKTMKYAKFGIDAFTFKEGILQALSVSEEEKNNYRSYAKKHSWELIFKKFEIILREEGIL